MQDRTHTVQTRTITQTPRGLSAVFFDQERRRTVVPLSDVIPGTAVTVSGTITHLAWLDPHGGPVHATLTGGTGETATVEFDSDLAHRLDALFTVGTDITVAGHATRHGFDRPVVVAAFAAEPTFPLVTGTAAA